MTLPTMKLTPRRTLRGALAVLAALVVLGAPHRAHAQMIDDGIQVSRGELFSGYMYAQESWDTYWEGTLERTNGNIGTLKTRTHYWFGNYGLTSRLSVIGMLPRVATEATQGVLSGMSGLQDLTVAAKYLVSERRNTPVGTVKLLAVGAASLPTTDYIVDFYPLSIGSRSKRVSGRVTGDAQGRAGWYVTGSAAYTWRAGVTLDRPYYYTDGRFFQTEKVDLPNVAEWAAGGGYRRDWLITSVYVSQQRTLGGGDIRRQDMPFVSNRMNADRISAMVMVPVPKLPALALQAGYAYTLRGRNVGQATTFTAGAMYMFRSHQTAAP